MLLKWIKWIFGGKGRQLLLESDALLKQSDTLLVSWIGELDTSF